MKKILFALCIALISTAGFAQENKGQITGTVVDGNARTIESATITLLRAQDSAVVKMSVADKTGKYSFDDVPMGKYLVSVTAVGHQPGYSAVLELAAGKANMQANTIELVPLPKAMAAVVVTSKKPLIEQKVDRTIVNVEASVTSVGSSALEVLEKSPGISVDKDGNISLKGKPGVVVYIDGRPSYLSGADLANLLKSMNASQLDQIEIMTNPPAKYDAAGNSGVINIKTKKNKQFGYNGSLTSGYTQGRYARFNEGANFNYRNGRVNVFTNLSYNRNHRGEELYIKRNFINDATKEITSSFDQAATMKNSNYFYSGKAGLDFTASKKTTLGIVINGFYNPSTWISNTHSLIYEPNGDLRSSTSAYTRNDDTWKNYSGNFNFRTQIDSTGQELTGDLDYIRYKSSSVQPLYSYYFDQHGNESQLPDTLLGDLPQQINIYSGKMDYTLPLKNGAKFEAGIKSSYVRTDNNAIYENLLGGVRELDSSRTNHFIYKENINAAYANYSRSLGKKWKGQLGLRLENTNADGRSNGYEFNTTDAKFEPTEKKFRRRYTQLFPTAYLQFAASEQHQFVLNYGRRVNRPDYQDLNPFIHFLDRYTFEQGNPNLKPQFSHNVEFSHTYKGFLTSTLNYTSTNDIIQQVLEQNDNTNETYIKKANIASLKQVGLAISAYKEITKWWSGNVYFNVYNNHFKGVVNAEPISISLTGLMGQLQQQFKMGKGWAAEVSGFYRSKSVEGVIFIEPFAQVRAGFSKQVLKNKGTVKLNVNDIFAMGTFKGYSKYGDVDASFRNVNDSRAVSVSFTWRFNKGKENGAGQRKKGGADDERNRVKTGGGN